MSVTPFRSRGETGQLVACPGHGLLGLLFEELGVDVLQLSRQFLAGLGYCLLEPADSALGGTERFGDVHGCSRYLAAGSASCLVRCHHTPRPYTRACPPWNCRAARFALLRVA